MAYASRKEHTLVNMRLYLPKSWANTRSKARLRKCGVPKERRFQTRHELALEMLDESGRYLPHLWIAGDDEMGRSSQFRADLRERHKSYVLAVPSNTLVRDLEQEPPAYTGLGRPRAIPFVRVDKWCAALPPRAWTRNRVRDGEKGPLVVQAARTCVLAKTENRSKRLCEEMLLVIRERQNDGTWKHDYYICHDDRTASFDTPLTELVRVARTTHRIEECFQRGKSEAGLADYEVRTWLGWHHHQTLSLMAAWFLTQEARREKNHDPCYDRAAGAGWIGHALASRVAMRPPRETRPQCHTSSATQRESSAAPPQTA
jgi:SRSO17 transposase